MSDNSDDDNEISFKVKFLGRVGVVRAAGVQILEEAAQTLKGKPAVSHHGSEDPLLPLSTVPDQFSSEKAAKKSKVHLFLSQSSIDILENKTKFLLYMCPLSTVSFSAVLPSSPKVFGFVSRHPAADTYHCYLFQSKKFSHVLVTLIGDAFRASLQEERTRGGRDLIVEALRHKNKMLQKENTELKKKLAKQTDI